MANQVKKTESKKWYTSKTFGIIAAAVGGWEMQKVKVNALLKKQDSSYEKLVSK